MKDLLAANRYAQALFEVARTIHKDVEMEEELSSFSKALRSSPDLEKFLRSPYFKNEEKRKLLQKIYQKKTEGVQDILLNFFTILLEKNRFNLIHEIGESFKRIADTERGIGVAEIKTAVPLGPAAEQAIISRLEKIAGYKILVKKEVNPAIIGGVYVKIRNKVLDGTVKHKLEILKKELTKISNI